MIAMREEGRGGEHGYECIGHVRAGSGVDAGNKLSESQYEKIARMRTNFTQLLCPAAPVVLYCRSVE